MDQSESERKEKHPSLPPDYVSLAQLQERWIQKQRDQSERKEKKHSLLPPDYVSLAQLRERWLQKQREKEMSEKLEMEMSEKREKEMSEKREKETREKQEKEMSEKREKEMREKREEDSKKQQRGGGLNANQNQRRLLKTEWRENKASIEDRGKGKETVIDGFENKKSDYKKKRERKMMKKKKKKKKAESRRREFEKGKEIAKEKLESDSNKEFNGGIEGVLSWENSVNGGLKGPPAKEIVNRIVSHRKTKFVKGIEVAKEKLKSETNREFNGGIMGPNEEIVNITDPRSGFLRNGDNLGSGYYSRNRKFEKGIEVAKEKLESETNKEFNGRVKGALSVTSSVNDRLKGPNQEMVNRIDSRSGFSRNGDNRVSGYSSRNMKFKKGIEVAKEELEWETNKEFIGGVKEDLSVENSGNDGLKGPNKEMVNIIDSRSGLTRNGSNRVSRYNSRNKKFEKGIEVAKESFESETVNEFNGGTKEVLSVEICGKDWLKGPNEEIVNIIDSRSGFSRNGDNRGSGCNSRKKKFEKGIESAKEKLESEPNKKFIGGIKGGLSVENSGKDRLKGPSEEIVDRIDSKSGFSRNGDTQGSGNDSRNKKFEKGVEAAKDKNGSTVDKKADEMVLALERVGICEKGGVGNGYRRYGNNGRRFRGGDWKSNVADGGQYARGHLKMKERDNSSMMWVKKEDKTGAYDDARVGSSGISGGN